MRTKRKIEYDRRYYREHKKEISVRVKAFYYSHRKEIAAYGKKYYDQNKDRLKDVWNTRQRKRYLLHRDSMLEWQRIHHQRMRIEILELLGGCFCKECGFSDWRALQIDHIEGGGHEERKKQKEIVKKNPERYQVLCANCNWIKKYEKGESSKKRIQTQTPS